MVFLDRKYFRTKNPKKKIRRSSPFFFFYAFYMGNIYVEGGNKPTLCRGGNMDLVGVDTHSFVPWDDRSPPCPTLRDVPFPPRRTGRYRKGMISAPRRTRGSQEIGLES